MIYFDAAATTLRKPPGVRRAVARAIGEFASPGRGGYRQAQLAKNGCGYCLRLSGRYAASAAALLQGVQGIWRCTESGYEEAGRDLL